VATYSAIEKLAHDLLEPFRLLTSHPVTCPLDEFDFTIRNAVSGSDGPGGWKYWISSAVNEQRWNLHLGEPIEIAGFEPIKAELVALPTAQCVG
jgi:hypothetical protein